MVIQALGGSKMSVVCLKCLGYCRKCLRALEVCMGTESLQAPAGDVVSGWWVY